MVGSVLRRLSCFFCFLVAYIPLAAQDFRLSAPQEDTVFVPEGQWVLIDQQVLYTLADTFFVVAPDVRLEIINSSRSQSFYDSLEAKLKRRRLTSPLYSLLIRRPRPSPPAAEEEVEQTRAVFLPFEGKIIRNIVFQRVDLFDGQVDDTLRTSRSWTGKMLNAVHVETRPGILRRFLLFDLNDELNADRLADTEQLLRSLRHIEDARIYVVPWYGDPSGVEIRVVTKDRFSMGVDGSMRDLGRFRAGIYDHNFLGQGVSMIHQMLYNGHSTRPYGYQGRLRLNTLGDKIVTTDIEYLNTQEMRQFAVRFDRGFFTPGLRYAGGFETASTNRLSAQFAAEGRVEERPCLANLFDLWAARFFDLAGREQRSHLSAALRYVGVSFQERPEVGPEENFYFHNRKLLLANLTLVSRRYFRSRNFSGFGDTEDIPIGFSAALTGGYDMGEFHRRPYAGLELAQSFWINKVGYFGLEGAAAGFQRNGRWEDGLVRLHGLYFTPLVRLQRFKLRQLLDVEYIRGVDRVSAENQLHLRSRLRGFPAENPEGQHRLTVRLETVLFTPWDLYGFKTALFAFSDAGYVSQQAPLLRDRCFFGSVGAGIRLRNPSLVLPTLELRLAYLPRTPLDYQRWFADYDSRDPRLFLNLNPTKPQLPGFE